MGNGSAPPQREQRNAGLVGGLEIGERLRAERGRQSIGVRELSRRVGVSASMISQIERGRVMPSVNTLYAIITALDVSLDDLLAVDPAGTATPVVAASTADTGPVQRAGSRKSLTLASGVSWQLLTATPHTNVEFLHVTYEVGGESTAADALVRHAGEEYGLVLEGCLGVTVGFESYELHAGDSICFNSMTPHRLFNVAPQPTTGIWVVVGRDNDPRLAPAA